MSEVEMYQCPKCGGVVVFDSLSQKMKCQYCDSEFDISELKKAATDEAPTMHYPIYRCEACQGEIIVDDTTGSTTCPFCGNVAILTDQFSDELRPDQLIPFQLDQKAAKAGLRKHLKNKWLLPKIFKDEQHIDKIQGVYVPFWLFDDEIEADASFHAKRHHVHRRKDTQIIETNHYQVIRQGTIAFSNVPVDASSKVDKALMDALEPFDLSQAVAFDTAYLAGFMADRYDLSKETCQKVADARMEHSMRQALDHSVIGYDSVVLESFNARHSQRQARYVLYPVWLLNTSWQGQSFHFAMNGQTGRFVGDLPVDKRKYWLLYSGFCLFFALLIFGLLYWITG